MLEVKNLSYSYGDGKIVLKDVNIKINKGETIGLIGSNGAGKSTLIKLMVGILNANEGEIIVDGIQICKKSLKEVRKKVGVVFQNPDNQLFMKNVYDDIAFGLRNIKMSEDDIKVKVTDIANKLNIEELLYKSPNNLSGGEKRKVSIGTVIAMDPSYILFDEPTSFLDPKGKRLFIETIKNLNTTKIIATHDLDMVRNICDRIIVLNKGLVVNGDNILNNEKLLMEYNLA